MNVKRIFIGWFFFAAVAVVYSVAASTSMSHFTGRHHFNEQVALLPGTIVVEDHQL